ncbi:MAG: hypothetical protein KDA25_05500 [Phycisphaerales bacterium]|nr:hypothetical protein [Phycisphaerales bacterium]
MPRIAHPTTGAVAALVTGLITGLVTGTTLGAPPVVVRTMPAHGDAAVDPGLREIVIEFDQDMAPDGYSLVGGGPQFPGRDGEPAWRTPRTFVLPVALDADQLYTFSINLGDLANFRNVDGESAIARRLTFITRPHDGVATDDAVTPDTNRLALAELRAAIDERYAYRDRLGIDWSRRFDDAADTFIAAPTARAFAVHAGTILAEAADLHVSITVGDESIPVFGRAVSGNIAKASLARSVPDLHPVNRTVMRGTVGGDIPYLLITTWAWGAATDLQAALDAIAEARDAPGLIIDVRPNAGGSEPLAERVASRFVDEPRVYAKHITRDAALPGGFTPVSERVLDPAPEGERFGAGRVAVLMGPRNMSSCEAFLLMMKQSPRCRLVGARSWGSSGNPKPVALSNGVSLMLPSWQAMRPDGTVFEGEGIAPDLEVRFDPAASEAPDPVIERAATWIRDGR